MKLCNSLYIYLFVLSICSCNTKEGCKSPLAQNFDAEADVDCCCSYYQLQVGCTAVSDVQGSPFQFLNVYADSAGNPFQLKNVQLLLHDFQLIDSNGISYPIQDSILLESQNQSVWFVNDFQIYKPSTLNVIPGPFTRIGNYKQIQFSLGLNNLAQTINPNSVVSNNHPLHTNSEMYFDSKYLSSWFEVYLPNNQTTKIFRTNQSYTFVLPVSLEVKEGQNNSLSLSIDLYEVLKDIDFSNNDSLQIVQKMNIKLPYAFRTN